MQRLTDLHWLVEASRRLQAAALYPSGMFPSQRPEDTTVFAGAVHLDAFHLGTSMSMQENS
jgi:hypothetical protein